MHAGTFSFSSSLTVNVCPLNAINAYTLGGDIFLQLRLYMCGWVSKDIEMCFRANQCKNGDPFITVPNVFIT